MFDFIEIGCIIYLKGEKMDNKKLFEKLENFVKENFGDKFELEILTEKHNMFDDKAQIYLVSHFGKIKKSIFFSSFLQLKQQIDEFGLEKVLCTIKDYLSDEYQVFCIDPLLLSALKISLDNNFVSTTIVQKNLKIGYPRASRIIDQMEDFGFVEGNCPRKLTLTKEEFEKRFGNVSLPAKDKLICGTPFLLTQEKYDKIL